MIKFLGDEDRKSLAGASPFQKNVRIAAMNTLLSLRNLSLEYCSPLGTRIPVLRGATLEIGDGEAIGLLGASGSGKSTLLRFVLGMPTGFETSQCESLEFESQNLLAMTDRERHELRRCRMGIIFQDPASRLSPFRKVNLQIADAFQKPSTEEELAHCLDQVGLGGSKRIASSYPHQLSGGECQRVAIAQALAASPSLLLADEPTSALDTTSQRQIIELLRRIRTVTKFAMLIVSHDTAVLRALTDRILLLEDGIVIDYVQPRPISVPLPRALPVPTASNQPLLAVENLDFKFGESRGWRDPLIRRSFHHALKQVNLSVNRGECLAIIGTSGSGKSTLAKCIAGIHSAQSGKIVFCGKRLTEPRDHQARSQVQIILQDTESSLNPRLTVRQILEEPLQIQRHQRSLVDSLHSNRGAFPETPDKVLADVSLSAAYLDRHPPQLSGGQRQRVAIARALVLQPTLLLLDEALSGLDRELQNSILDLLRSLRTGRRLTCIHFSHDIGQMLRIADRIAVMDHGEIVETHLASQFPLDARHPASLRLLDAMLIEEAS